MALIQLCDPCFEVNLEHIAMFHYFISTAVFMLPDVYISTVPTQLMPLIKQTDYLGQVYWIRLRGEL